jgi:hypothetical protein
MKLFFLILLVIVVSCNSGSSQKEIKGTWVTVHDNRDNEFTDTLTFYKQDSFKIISYRNGQLMGEQYGRYTLNLEQKKLTTYLNSDSSQSEIDEFSDSVIIIKNKNSTETKIRKVQQSTER